MGDGEAVSPLLNKEGLGEVAQGIGLRAGFASECIPGWLMMSGTPSVVPLIKGDGLLWIRFIG